MSTATGKQDSREEAVIGKIFFAREYWDTICEEVFQKLSSDESGKQDL